MGVEKLPAGPGRDVTRIGWPVFGTCGARCWPISSWRSTTSGRTDREIWDHCWTLAGLHKSSTVQALLSGRWPAARELSWRRLRVGIRQAKAAEVARIKELIEVEYPLGNELMRTDAEAHFSFPGLDGRPAANLLEELRLELGCLLGRSDSPEMHLSPRSKQEADQLVGRSAC